jgi:hypothetical protein
MKKARRVFVIVSVIFLMIGSVFAGAVTINNSLEKNQNNSSFVTAAGQLEETYTMYGINHGSASNMKSSPDFEWATAQDHPPFPFIEDSYAEFTIQIYPGGHGVAEGSLEIGVEFWSRSAYPWVEGPDLYVYNFKDDEMHLRKKSMGTNDNLQWKWYTMTRSNEFINSRGEVKIKVLSSYYDDITISEVGVKFKDNEFTDQTQIETNGARSVNLLQPFTPSFEKLTRIKLLLKPNQASSAAKQINLRIETPEGEKITPINSLGLSVNFLCHSYVGKERWVGFDVEDIQLLPDKTYYINVEIPGNSFSWCFYEAGGRETFCYKTYGGSECDEFDPELNLDETELTFIVKKTRSNPNPDVGYQTFKILNTGTMGSGFKWTASDDADWLSLKSTSGLLYYPHGSNNDHGYYFNYAEIDYSGIEGTKEGVTSDGTITVETEDGDEETIDVILIVYKVKPKSKLTSNLLEIICLNSPALQELLLLLGII